VIGGGQAGLAVGFYLARQGRQFVILDVHQRVGDAWRNRWDSLRLFTPARFNSLPGMTFPGPAYAVVTKDEVADYLEHYATAMHLPVRTGVEARKVSRATDGGWTIETSDGRVAADAVIIATGGYQTPNLPDWARELDPDIVQLHSMDYRNPAQFQAGPVLVVGASHSGAEIAIEAASEHQTILAGRDTGQVPLPTTGWLVRVTAPLIWFAVTRVLTVDTPIGRKMRPQVRAHGFPLEHPGRGDILAAGVERITERASGVRDGKPMLADGRVLDVRNVVWCTGFRGDYGWIEGLAYGEDGYPEQDHGVVTSAPGLYFVGLKFQRAGASALVGGVAQDAAIVASHIAARIAKHSAMAKERT
jgi:putative flavoprotein involved in K+ transport